MLEKADDGHLGQDDCRDIPDLGYPRILSTLLALPPETAFPLDNTCLRCVCDLLFR